MQRSVWKGAISFGLVHIPIGLYPAAQEVFIAGAVAKKPSPARPARKRT